MKIDEWRRKGERVGGREEGQRDGETVCAVLIRLWGRRRKEWSDMVLLKG